MIPRGAGRWCQTGPVQRISFAKGHGTQNDFVIIPDPEDMLHLSADQVRAICHRRAGVGGDGVLRAVRAAPGGARHGQAWFMDYRNADGSTAQMCGNGVRVFARFLLDEGWVTGPEFEIATRDGRKQLSVCADGRLRVAMGPLVIDPQGVEIGLHGWDRPAMATPAEMGNPHAVVFVDDLWSVPLATPPAWTPPDRFPDGVNVEFVRPVAHRHIAVRVHERGCGETQSCGTGVCAAAGVAAYLNSDRSRPVTYQVDVPGGTLDVELDETDTYLTGPATIVASGTLQVPTVDPPHQTP